ATVGERSRAAGAAIATELGSAAVVRLHESNHVGELPCDAQRPCVIVTGAQPSVRVPADRHGPTFLVRVGERLSPNVAVSRLQVSAAHIAAAGVAAVRLTGDGVDGRQTRLRLLDGEAVVGEVIHRWNGEREADVELAWWPVAAGTRTLVAQAALVDGTEATDLDNQARASVAVADDAWPVLVLERRPSWAATFARRALDVDRRLTVEAWTDVAPGVSARTAAADAILDDAQLDRARVVVVGAPDALRSDDVSRLDAFVRKRGGALVLVPDRAFSGPVTRLLPHPWRERPTGSPVTAGGLQAREWLIADGTSAFDAVLASVEAGPAIVSTPAGPGRIVVVGAMDAWRARGDGAQFDRFWQDTIARLAQAAGPALAVSAEPPVSVVGDDLQVRVSARSVRSLPAWVAGARLQCGSGSAIAVRLWPDHAPGEFVGRARVPAGAERCAVVGEVDGVGERRAEVKVIPTAEELAPAEATQLDAVVARTGGLVATDRDLSPVTSALRALASDVRTPEARYPMRSPWWLPLLVACLAGEWWLRRRAGLR
ncbi:MAG: hypothetical protein OEW19_16715, partial [Acidobacteriota bacterium]|nr:hypothetical protein [Acidobacteriota bacterium]